MWGPWSNLDSICTKGFVRAIIAYKEERGAIKWHDYRDELVLKKISTEDHQNEKN